MNRIVKICAMAVVAALAMASAANATTVIGAKTIQITSGAPINDDYIQVAELIATQAGTGTDVALASNGGVATALNEYCACSGPGNAIDGVYPAAYPDIYHSLGTTSDYLDITLANPDNLSSLTIYGRTDCCQERDIYDVTIFNADGGVLYSGVLDGTGAAGGPTTVTFGGGVPEPAAWALMLAGFGGLGAAMRARRKTAAMIVTA